MGCCFCCMSEDAQIQAVMEKLEVDRVSNALHGHTKFWVGRIMVTTEALIAPVSGKQCAYYEVVCEEHQKQIHHDPETGHTHETWEWVHQFTEEKSSDFLIADPRGSPAFVPGSKYQTKFYSVVDASNQDHGGHGGLRGFFSGETRSDTIEAMLRRNGQQGFFGGSDSGRFRYRESSFMVNEQVAILGTAQPYNHQGVDMTILCPPSSTILTDDYFEANEWTSNERKSWEALTSQPSVIGSDDPKYFKGVSIEDIPFNYSPYAFCAPVVYGQQQAPMMQQQGQPLMQQQGQPMMQQQGQPMMQQQGQPLMQQQGQPMMQQQGQPMMQQQGQPMMQQQGQPMMQQQGQPMMQQQGQPMMQQQGQPLMQQQGQPMMQQQGQPMMQQQGQPMMQQQGQPMMQQQGQPLMQQQGQNYGPSTVVPSGGVIPTINPNAVAPTPVS